MKQCAVVKNGNDIIKVSNLKRKFNKIQNNPLMEILEECDLEELETKYNYYKKQYEPLKEEDNCDITLYYYKYKDNPCWLVSIFDNEESRKPVIKKTKSDYLKAFNK